MNLGTLKTPSMRRAKNYRKGRGIGSGNGKRAGRGQKGYYARTGNTRKRAFEGGQMSLWRRLPKRGFNNFLWATRYAPVNVGDLAKVPAGTVVDWESLIAAGLVPGRFQTLKLAGVKILGTGELPAGRKLEVRAHAFTASAREKLEKAGCKVVELASRYATGK